VELAVHHFLEFGFRRVLVTIDWIKFVKQIFDQHHRLLFVFDDQVLNMSFLEINGETLPIKNWDFVPVLFEIVIVDELPEHPEARRLASVDEAFDAGEGVFVLGVI
jgi:hypothetical protein